MPCRHTSRFRELGKLNHCSWENNEVGWIHWIDVIGKGPPPSRIELSANDSPRIELSQECLHMPGCARSFTTPSWSILSIIWNHAISKNADFSKGRYTTSCVNVAKKRCVFRVIIFDEWNPAWNNLQKQCFSYRLLSSTNQWQFWEI